MPKGFGAHAQLGLDARRNPLDRCLAGSVAKGRTRRRKTTVDQTLMRVLVSAGPVSV